MRAHTLSIAGALAAIAFSSAAFAVDPPAAGASAPQGRVHRGPSAAAIAACTGKTEGTPVTWVGRKGHERSGKCVSHNGTMAGKAAVQLQPNKPEGHFWLGANYGGTAAHSTLSNLSSFQDIKGEMEAVLKLDESYQGYSAYVGLGRLYLQAPKVLGGDVGKAIDYLEKGLKLNPNNTVMRFHLAEAYEANNRDTEAKKEIETIITTTPDPKYIAEHKMAVDKAKKLQEKITADSRG